MTVFYGVLLNTFVANISTVLLWFALTFWAYLETRSVLATSVMGGLFMLLAAVCAVPFGGLVDRHRKKQIMVAAALISVVFFAAAFVVYVATPYGELVRLDRPWFWVFITLILLGAVLESIRGIALSTCVTLLVPSERRANANGLVGMAMGATMLVGGVFAGLAVGLLGILWVVVISLGLAVLTLAHLAVLSIPEPQIVASEEGRGAVDFKRAWAAVMAVPALIGLIAFSTFNNLLGGVFMGLLDPYGLELMSVQAWGILFGLSSLGFIVGGGWIAKFGLGATPLRALLLANVLLWLIAATFTLRDSVLLLAIGICAYMAIVPVVEGAEQTVLQRVVPYPQQGRVFGFAQAVEVAAAPLSAFVIGPVAEFWLIPYANSDAGRASLSGLLGEGDGRGIALVFVLASLVGLVVTLLAFTTRTYRRLSDVYAAGDVNADLAQSITAAGVAGVPASPRVDVPAAEIPGPDGPLDQVPAAEVPDTGVAGTEVADTGVAGTEVADAEAPDAEVRDAEVRDAEVRDAKGGWSSSRPGL